MFQRSSSLLLLICAFFIFGAIGCSSSDSPVVPARDNMSWDNGDPGGPIDPDPPFGITTKYFDVDYTRQSDLWDTGLVRIREPWRNSGDPGNPYGDPGDPDGSGDPGNPGDPNDNRIKAQVFMRADNHNKTVTMVVNKYPLSGLVGAIYYGKNVIVFGNDGFTKKVTETLYLWVRPGNNDDSGSRPKDIINGRYIKEVETWNSGTPPGPISYTRWVVHIDGEQTFDNSDPDGG